jgi:hypothetical protein
VGELGKFQPNDRYYPWILSFESAPPSPEALATAFAFSSAVVRSGNGHRLAQALAPIDRHRQDRPLVAPIQNSRASGRLSTRIKSLGMGVGHAIQI